jgi:hypothetical protein
VHIGRAYHTAQPFFVRGEDPKEFSRLGGRDKPLKRLDSDKEIKGESKGNSKQNPCKSEDFAGKTTQARG